MAFCALAALALASATVAYWLNKPLYVTRAFVRVDR